MCSNFKELINLQEIRINWSFIWNRRLFCAWNLSQNLFVVSRTAKKIAPYAKFAITLPCTIGTGLLEWVFLNDWEDGLVAVYSGWLEVGVRANRTSLFKSVGGGFGKTRPNLSAPLDNKLPDKPARQATKTNKQASNNNLTRQVCHVWITIELWKRYNLLAVVAESCGTTHSRIPCNLEIWRNLQRRANKG